MHVCPMDFNSVHTYNAVQTTKHLGKRVGPRVREMRLAVPGDVADACSACWKLCLQGHM